jgi:hypothetical protein
MRSPGVTAWQSQTLQKVEHCAAAAPATGDNASAAAKRGARRSRMETSKGGSARVLPGSTSLLQPAALRRRTAPEGQPCGRERR